MLRNLRLAVFVLSVFFWAPVFLKAAAENTVLKAPCCENLEELKADYFKDNRYNEFVDFLNNFKDKNKLSAGCINIIRRLSATASLNIWKKNNYGMIILPMAIPIAIRY